MEGAKRIFLYLHSPSTPSWHGAKFKKAQGQLDLFTFGFLEFAHYVD
jgi:hypothetical protein